MREIEFRGKRIDNGEWVYGDFIYSAKVGVFSEKHKIHTKQGEYIMVKKGTIGQFTGYVDNAGERVYEGDIFKPTPTAKHTYPIGEVSFYKGGWVIKSTKGDVRNLYTTKGNVIGNIVNYPELMEADSEVFS